MNHQNPYVFYKRRRPSKLGIYKCLNLILKYTSLCKVRNLLRHDLGWVFSLCNLTWTYLKLAEWGQATMVDAEKCPLANTVLDFSNKTFMLLSETNFFLILFLFLVAKSKSRISQVTQVIWSSYQFLNLGPRLRRIWILSISLWNGECPFHGQDLFKIN